MPSSLFGFGVLYTYGDEREREPKDGKTLGFGFDGTSII